MRTNSDSILRAKLEFGVMRSAFDRAHTAWSHAPGDLKPAMLLRGQTLQRAESWLYDFPEKLGDSEKSFIMASIAKNAMRDDDRVKVIDKVVSKSSNATFWLVVVTFFLIVRLFIPMVVEQVVGVSVKAPPKAPVITARPTPMSDAPASESSESEGSSDRDGMSDTASADQDDGSRQPTAQELHRKAVAEAQRTQRHYTDLARTELGRGHMRTAMLLALELAHKDQPEALPPGTNNSRTVAAALIVESLSEKIAALPTPAAFTAGPAILSCGVGKTIVAASSGGALHAIRGDGTSLALALAKRDLVLRGAAVSGDCERIALAGDDHTMEIWSIGTGRRLAVLAGHEGDIRASAFSRDGTLLATASQDSTVRLWDARTGRVRAVLEGHEREVLAVAFNPAGERLVTAAADQTLRLWQVGQARPPLVLVGHAGMVTQAMFSPDGSRILSIAVDGHAIVWDATTGKMLSRLQRKNSALLSVTFSPDGGRVAAITQDGEVVIWIVAGTPREAMLPTGGDTIRELAFTPDGKWLITTSWSGNAALWNGFDGERIAGISHTDGQVVSTTFAEGGRRGVSFLKDGSVASWPLFGPSAEAIAYARSIAGSCLAAQERTELGLDPEQPSWCGGDAAVEPAER